MESPIRHPRTNRGFFRLFLQLYRLAVLVVIAGIIRGHAVRLRVEGHAPITVAEVRDRKSVV